MTGALGLLLAALAGASEPPPLRIASDATFPPFHFLEGSTPTGFDIELARIVVARAGFRPVVLVRPYDDLLPGLAAGAHDLVAATTGVTPEREKLYLFTRPVFDTCQAALVRVGPKEPKSINDLQGRRVGAAGEGTSARALRGIAGVARVTLGKGEAGVPSLEKGDIDALVVDEWSAVASARASKGRLRVLPQPVALERYAFVLPLHKADWKRALDDALAGLESEGQVRALRIRFGLERGEDWPITLSPAAAEGLSLDHQPVRCVVAGKFPVFEARMEPAGSVTQARIAFRSEAGLHWYSVAMKRDGGVFRGTLPQPTKSLERFQYYIEGTTAEFQSARTPEVTAAIVAGPGACQQGLVAGTLASATVAIVAPQGAAALPLVPAGFSSAGVASASGAAAAASGGSSIGKALLIAGGVVGAGAAAYVVLKGEGWENANWVGTDSEGGNIQMITGSGFVELFSHFQTSGQITCSPSGGFQGEAPVSNGTFQLSFANSSGTFDVNGQFTSDDAAAGQMAFTVSPGYTCPPPSGTPRSRTISWSATKTP